MIALLSVSLSGGLTFSAPVSTGGGGIEMTIVNTTVYNIPWLSDVAGVTVVPVPQWDNGPPTVGDGWRFSPPPLFLTADAPAVGFAAGSGVITE